MPRIGVEFTARWSRDIVTRALVMGRSMMVPPGTLILSVDESDRRVMHDALVRLDERQHRNLVEHPDRDHELPLRVTLEVAPRHRSLDANALMWHLYEVTAAAMNGDQTGEGAVTKEDLYRQDMMDHGEVLTVRCREQDLDRFRRYGWTWKQAVATAQVGYMLVDLLITSSKWDSLRMHQHIRMMIVRLSDLQIPQRYQVSMRGLFLDWRRELNDHPVDLDGEIVTQDQYREANPFCEACGVYIAHEHGQLSNLGELHHVSSRGSGVSWGPEKERPENWMHLCGACHSIWNEPGGGSRVFVARYPHVARKVNEALRRWAEEDSDDGMPTPEDGGDERYVVTRDMAMDAGEPELEGSEW